MQRLKKLSLLLTVALTTILAGCGSVQPLNIESLGSVEIKELSLKKIDVGMDVTVFNPNSFNVKVKDLVFNVQLNNLDLGEIHYEEVIKLKANKSTTVSVSVSSSLAKVLLQAPGAFVAYKTKSSLPLKLDGTFKAGNFIVFKKFEVTHTEEVKLKR